MNIPNSQPDFGVTPIKPVHSGYRNNEIETDTPFLAGFMLDRPHAGD